MMYLLYGSFESSHVMKQQAMKVETITSSMVTGVEKIQSLIYIYIA